MDASESLLHAWRENPEPERAAALCRVLAARVSASPDHRRKLTEVAPLIAQRHAGEVPVQLELSRACMAAGDMFLADAVLKPLLQVAPNEPQVWRLLGEVFLRAGNARDAETAFEGALARGLRDGDTLRWHEKARSARPLQDAGGHAAVAAEVARWMASWGTTPTPAAHVAAPPAGGPAIIDAPVEAAPLVDAPDSQRTVIREPSPFDLDATLQREPSGPVLPPPPKTGSETAPVGASDKIPDSDRTAFYQKPAAPVEAAAPPAAPRANGADAPAFDPAARAPHRPSPQRTLVAFGAVPQPTAAGEPKPVPPPAPPPPAVAGDKSLLDEESMDIDVLKLPEGDKLDEVLEALRKSEGLVIEEPTGFYQVPQVPQRPAGAGSGAPPIDALAATENGNRPNLASFGTILMAPAEGAGAPGGLPVPPPPPLPTPESPSAPGRRVEAASAGARAVESPSGVIIKPPSDPNAIPAPVESSESFGMAPTLSGPSLAAYASGEPAGMLMPGPPPFASAAPPLPVGPGPKATTLRPPKAKRRWVSALVVLVIALVVAAIGFYLVRVRGLLH